MLPFFCGRRTLSQTPEKWECKHENYVMCNKFNKTIISSDWAWIKLHGLCSVASDTFTGMSRNLNYSTQKHSVKQITFVKQKANIISYKSAKTDGQDDYQIQGYEMTNEHLLQAQSLVLPQKQLLLKRFIRHFKVSAAHLDLGLRITWSGELSYSSWFQHVLPKLWKQTEDRIQ